VLVRKGKGIEILDVAPWRGFHDGPILPEQKALDPLQRTPLSDRLEDFAEDGFSFTPDADIDLRVLEDVGTHGGGVGTAEDHLDARVDFLDQCRHVEGRGEVLGFGGDPHHRRVIFGHGLFDFSPDRCRAVTEGPTVGVEALPGEVTDLYRLKLWPEVGVVDLHIPVSALFDGTGQVGEGQWVFVQGIGILEQPVEWRLHQK